MYYAFTPNSVFKSVLPFGLRTFLINQYVILRYRSSNLCKRHYLYGALPFFKIQVSPFMAQDEPFGAKIIRKCILWGRGLVPVWVLRHSFLSLTDCWWLYNIQLKTLSAPFWCLGQKLSVSPLYFNKTLLTQKLWAIKPRLWPRIEFFSSSGQESLHCDSTTSFQSYLFGCVGS